MLLLKPNLERIARVGSTAVVLIGALVLAGWWLRIDALVRIAPGWPAMVVRTAFMLVLAGTSLFLLAGREIPRWKRRIAIAVAAGVAIIAILNALDYLLDWDLGGQPASIHTSLTVLLFAVSIALLGRRRNASEPIVLAALSIPLLALLGYLFGVPAFYSVPALHPYAGMAVHTAVALLLLGGSVLCARPEGRVLPLLLSRHAGGRAARLLLILLLVLPAAAIPITAGERLGWYPLAVGSALLVFVAMAIGLVLIVTAGCRLEEIDHKLEEVTHAAAAVTEAIAEVPPTNVAAVLHALALQAQAITGAEYAGLGVGTDPEKPFDPWVQVGVTEEVAHRIGRAPRPVGTLGVVACGDRSLRLRDVHGHPNYRGLPPHHPEMTSFLGVPIRFRGRAVGNLYLADKRTGAEFTAQDERLMLLLAARAGVAIEIASMYAGETAQRSWQQAIIDQMPEGVVIVDERGSVVTQNVIAQSLSRDPQRKNTRGDPITHDLRDPSGAPVPDDQLPLERAFARGETVSAVELLIVGPDEQRMPVLVSATPVLIEGRRAGAVAVFQDIRTLKELEQLREEWTAVVAHDLRQPLSGIAMSIELLARFHAAGEHAREPVYLDRIKQGTRRLQNMIQDLLDASRIESHRLSTEPKPFDLGTLIEETCADVPELVGHPLAFDLPAEGVLVNADPARVAQVINNLLSNASKYGEPGTPIGIDVAVRARDAEVIVTNRGAGIDPDDLPHLFQRFSRKGVGKKRGIAGIGLGLYISKGLVEANGGRIWVESTPNEATRFHFTLPLALD